MQLKKSSIAWLLFLNFAVEVTGSSVTSNAVTTNIGGLPITQTVALEQPEKRAAPAAAPAAGQAAGGQAAGQAAGGQAAGQAAGGQAAGQAAGGQAAGQAAGGQAAGQAAGGQAAGQAAGGQAAGQAAGQPAANGDTTTTTSGSGSTTGTSSATSKTGTVTHQTTRPDPSLSKYTPPPSSPVTTLSMDTLATMTEMESGKTKIYTTTREHTSNLWVTVTKDGTVTPVQTTFAQRFTKQYDKIATPKSGSVGLGSIKGRVGVVKSAMKYTLSSSNGVVPQFINDGSIFLSLVAFLMWFL